MTLWAPVASVYKNDKEIGMTILLPKGLKQSDPHGVNKTLTFSAKFERVSQAIL